MLAMRQYDAGQALLTLNTVQKKAGVTLRLGALAG